MQEGATASPSPGQRAIKVNITVRTMLIAIAILAVVWMFIAVRTAVLTLFLALFSALVLNPVVDLVQRKLKLGRGPAALIVVLGLVAFGILCAWILISPFVNSMSDFVDALPSIVAEIRNSSLGSWLDSHSQAPEQTQANIKQIAKGIGDAAGGILGVALSAFSL
ncbi:MAG TPA: AI-2E family transporter, partial [Gaiellaceae bacterium]|nr:AI-2E family transporter [Gaiellaceae bacterium]